MYTTRIFLVVGLLLCAVFTATAHAERRIALVIGNSAYKDAPLANPENDSRLIAGTLRKLGFDVAQVSNASQKEMKRAIQGFGDKLTEAGEDGVGLFYYAGHGVQVGGRNFLIPLGGEIRRESDMEIEGVAADWVLRQMEFARSRLNIVILDACRNNPFKRSFRSASSGLARMDAPSGTLIAYSTAPGKVAEDGSGRNSPYSSALARTMTQPGLKVEDMFKRVRVSVMQQTSDQQVPWEASSLTGDFAFAKGGEGARQQVAALPPPAAATSDATSARLSREVVFWRSIESSDDPNEFQAYLDTFGADGTFSQLARNRVTKLRARRSGGNNRSLDNDLDAAKAAVAKARDMLNEFQQSSGSLMGNNAEPLALRLERFRGMLGTVVDFDPMARFVVGDFRKRLSDADWDEFKLLYQELFLSGYDFTSGKAWAGEFEVEDVRPYGPDYLITIRLNSPTLRIERIGLRIRRKDEAFFGFMIIDALLDGVSLLVTQKADFQAVLKRDGMAGLREMIENRVGGPIAKPIEIPG